MVCCLVSIYIDGQNCIRISIGRDKPIKMGINEIVKQNKESITIYEIYFFVLCLYIKNKSQLEKLSKTYQCEIKK